MADLLKNLYNKAFFDELCLILEQNLDQFDKNLFLKLVYDGDWENRELKARMKHLAIVLERFLPHNFSIAAKVLERLIDSVKDSPLSECRLEFMFVTEYLEKHGIDHFDTAMDAMEFITQFTSCEFAVRPFIIRYKEKMMQQMVNWSQNENHHVRRLASEGCRPRLPWSMALPDYIKDPSPVLPVLENLKDDPSEYVRRSVANNLNDISKDNPEIVLDLAQEWIGKNENRDKIVKHACRTLLKKGDVRALRIFGFLDPAEIEICNLRCDSAVRIGETLLFSFRLKQCGSKNRRLRIEYGIDYVKSNGSTNRKIFQISEIELNPGHFADFKRSRSFRNFTTRKHYPGRHALVILVNGRELAKSVFMLLE